MAAQQDISFELNGEMMGKRIKVLVDRREGEYWIGRTEFDSPEVDNEVLITGTVPAIGEFCEVEIFDTAEFDLFGQVV